MSEKEIRMGHGNESWHGNYIESSSSVKTITFCVTEDCNLVCRYCYMTGKNSFKKMTFEVAKKAVDFIFDNPQEFEENSVVFDFIGGEPFLEVDLIDKICDYLKVKMMLSRPDWLNSYRFSFSTNGLLYSTEKVQNFIKKHGSHTSIGISVDGDKRKHDLQRIFRDGSGSYDRVMENVELWKKQYMDHSTKSTFSHDDLPHLKDSVISLWNNGINDVSANVIFENVWQEGDAEILEKQLDELGDYILENRLWKDNHIRFFDATIGNPLREEDKKHNFCGSGKMLAIDCEGNFYPCIRFVDFAVTNRKGRSIGNVKDGINKDKLRAFQCLTLEDQSTQECINCKIATGCAFCTGFNYDEAGTIYKRSTSICEFHKATVRANKRFWRKYEDLTGELSPRREYERVETYKYIQIMTSDNITPHCNYRNTRGTNNVMSIDTINEAVKFGINNGYEIAFLGEPPKEFVSKNPAIVYIAGSKERKAGGSDQYINIYDNEVENIDENIVNNILVVNKDNLKNLGLIMSKLIDKSERVNLVIEDMDKWGEKELENYSIQLDMVIALVVDQYKKNNQVEVNVLTDRIKAEKHDNCTNGFDTFTLAPNGKFYICPAFYYDDPQSYIGDLRTGIINENERLMDINNSAICKNCDAYQCKACKFINKKKTEEYLVPSRIQCLIGTLERNKSMDLWKNLRDVNEEFKNIDIKEIEYEDPIVTVGREE